MPPFIERSASVEAAPSRWEGFLGSAPEHMYQAYRGTPGEARIANEKVFEFLKERVPLRNQNKKAGVTFEEASAIHRWLRTHPMVKNQRQYDPTGENGFCFGRATLAHLKAVNSGVEQKMVRKLWAVGALESKWGSKANHHVAVAIQATDTDDWWVIDTAHDEPVSPREWMENFEATWGHGPDKAIRLYATPAKRWGPHSADNYSRNALIMPEIYHGYFSDALKLIQAEVKEPRLRALKRP